MSTQNVTQTGPVIILGMHRSGTSCLAGALHEAGLYLGNVNEKAPHNAKGNRENRAIMDLHDQVLSANGGSWDSPPFTLTWTTKHAAARDALIESYPADRRWGFKDPRALITLQGWLDALPGAQCVATFRHPLAVAESLERRNDFPYEKSLDLWVRYNTRLLNYQREMNFDVINFDWPADRYRAGLVDMAARLGLVAPENGLSFFQPELRKSSTQRETRLPVEATEIYAALREIAV